MLSLTDNIRLFAGLFTLIYTGEKYTEEQADRKSNKNGNEKSLSHHYVFIFTFTNL
jgi:hypothetical protein